MRDIVLLLLLIGIIPYIFKRPVVGALAYAFIGLMNPHRLSYGFAYEFPFALIVSVVTLVSVVCSREPKKYPASSAAVMLLVLIGWMTFTALFALEPDKTWFEWSRVMKNMVMVVITILTVRTVNDAKALLLVVALSLGFWGMKGGMWTIMTGGHNGLVGPPGTYISDNNTLALAMVTSVPIMVALSAIAPTKWTKRAALGLAFLTGIAAIGSYSRGALLGSFAMVSFLWLKSASKAKTGILLLLLAPVIYASMPEQWLDRMHSIDNYQQDPSAMGRINAWNFAINVANSNMFGGGFNVFTPEMFRLYAPTPNVFHVAHSIYFQVLGEHGYFGLFLYLTLFFLSWRTATRLSRKSGNDPEYAWVVTTARMCQVSIIGFMAAGAFLAMAYYDLAFYILAILITLEKVLFLAPQPDNTPPLKIPFLRRKAVWGGQPAHAAHAAPAAPAARQPKG